MTDSLKIQIIRTIDDVTRSFSKCPKLWIDFSKFSTDAIDLPTYTLLILTPQSKEMGLYSLNHASISV